MNDNFEIRVAVIGYVSVGKTTLINALLGTEYGEVSMRRTTAVVNMFRLRNPKSELKSDPVGVTDGNEDILVDVDDKPLRTASDILEESTADNATYRNTEGNVEEKSYDVKLNLPLYSMRKNTTLVVVDIPGINEAGTSSKYMDYVNDKWHTFDIAVVVMDARQGVNTEEQHDLLKLVKQNFSSIKDIPIIIVCNKVDDPTNEEQRCLLNEARAAIEKLFEVQDREKSLETLMKKPPKKKRNLGFDMSFLPAVVPISAMHAFLYRCGARLTFDQFKRMDEVFIENIGKESYGRQWRKYDKLTKLEMAFKAVSEEEERQDGLEVSNFDYFMKVLGYCIGNEERQASIIKQQVDVALRRLAQAQDGCDLSAEFSAAYKNLKLLGLPTEDLLTNFWVALEKLKDDALATFDSELSPRIFERPLTQLTSYLHIVGPIGWFDQIKKVLEFAKDLVMQYAVKVFNHEKELSKRIRDFSLILGSMLLSCDSIFCRHFGALKLELDARYAEAKPSKNETNSGDCTGCNRVFLSDALMFQCDQCRVNWIRSGTGQCPQCLTAGRGQKALSRLDPGSNNGNDFRCNHCNTNFKVWKQSSSFVRPVKVDAGRLVPVDTDDYEKIASIVVPDSLEDPTHYGYPIWKCCRLIQKSEKKF